MSFHTYYLPFDEQSPLLKRLQEDAAFHTLFAVLTTLGPGPFHLELLEPDEISDTLDQMVRQSIFRSRADAEAALRDIRIEVAREERTEPGIGNRRAYLEQMYDAFEEWLPPLLTRVGTAAPQELLSDLLYGAEPVSSMMGRFEPAFRFVPPGRVAEGAAALEPFPLSTLIAEDEKWELLEEDYDPWRQVYLDCAKLGQVVLVHGS